MKFAHIGPKTSQLANSGQQCFFLYVCCSVAITFMPTSLPAQHSCNKHVGWCVIVVRQVKTLPKLQHLQYNVSQGTSLKDTLFTNVAPPPAALEKKERHGKNRIDCKTHAQLDRFQSMSKLLTGCVCKDCIICGTRGAMICLPNYSFPVVASLNWPCIVS